MPTISKILFLNVTLVFWFCLVIDNVYRIQKSEVKIFYLVFSYIYIFTYIYVRPPPLRKGPQRISVGLKLGFPRNCYIFCAKFARNFFFCELLRNFCASNAMSIARFCTIFWRKLRKTGNIFLHIFAHEMKRVLRKTESITQNVVFSAN